MAPTHIANEIYSATYSNVPVFEFACGGEHVMRRRHDDWINATHILKVAEFDKPARTRILERDVQKGVHEKVQGGYGKYQGTWVPLQSGRDLALRNGVFEKLRPIFDYIPGDISPPQAPKHTTAASNKPKIPKPAPMRRPPKPKPVPTARHMSEDLYENISAQLNDDESVEGSTIGSASFVDEDDMYRHGHTGGSRKRKRAPEISLRDQQHTMYADSLLDYFMLSSSDTPLNLDPPQLPESYEVEWKVDGQKHTALHWAAAMGDTEIVKTLLNRGADMFARNERGDTPLIRAVLFTNNHEKRTFPKIIQHLQATIEEPDYLESTILHHIAMLTTSRQKRKCARYYLEVLLTKASEYTDLKTFHRFLNRQDSNGDTALHIVVRHEANKCILALQGHHPASDIPNHNNETVNQMLQRSHLKQPDQSAFQPSSSPVQPDFHLSNGHALVKQAKPGVMTSSRYESQSAQSFSESFDSAVVNGGMQVALAMENEVREKDVQQAEAGRLLAAVEKQRQEIRRQTFAHINGYGDGDDDDMERADLRKELQALQAEQESLLEQNQHRLLHQDIRAEESALSPSVHSRANGTALSGEEVEARVQGAKDLRAEQMRRRDLTKIVAQAQANAGMSQIGEDCKRLVSSSTGIPIEEVPGVTAELLEQLQMSKKEVAAMAA